MLKEQMKSRLFIIIFVIVFCVPWFSWNFLGGNSDLTNYENRVLAEKPVFNIDTYDTFAEKYEAYFNDNLPYRNMLISFNSLIDYSLFGLSTNDRVIVGKNGWLFYNDVQDGDPIGCYKGKNMYTEEQLQAIAANLVRIQKYLEERGCEFVLFIAPNKERVYSEMLPTYYGEPAEMYVTLQVVEYIKANTDIRVIYPYEELMCAKKQLSEYIIYHKTDTHWNNLGGYVGSTALLRELGIYIPEITSREVSITEIENNECDLANMLNLANKLKNSEVNYLVEGYNKHDVVNEKWELNSEIIYHSTNADSRKLYIVRDSFCSAMSEYVGSQFNESYMIHTNMYSNSNLLEQDPDIFVLETVERNVRFLPSFDIEKE